ncbi:MAG: nitrogenase component 1 [Clostridiales bacterium]|nr:nitrogenase component 1 [Clostridiales bacterium]
MKELWITLPAFAPDYSGVCSAMFELGGISVIHDASGCTGNYTGYDEPRWYGSNARVFCSGLREIDAVLGRDDKLIDDILYACRDLQPAFITVLGSPVPMVIGTDMKGIAKELENRSGLPAFGFSTSGLYLYNKGISEAMQALVRRFSKPTAEIIPNAVNILGMTPLDFSTNSNAQDLPLWLERQGFTVLGRLMMGVTLHQIENLAKAQVNLVVTEAGMETAKLLKQTYGTPYVAALPICQGKKVVSLLQKTIEDGQDRVLLDQAEEGGLLIVAEQMLGNALRHEILRQSPRTRVTVATMFGLNPAIASPGDQNIPNEESLRYILGSGRFHQVVGDPLFKELISPADQIDFYPIPHPAVSSKLHWDEVPAWLGTDIEQLIHAITKGGETT